MNHDPRRRASVWTGALGLMVVLSTAAPEQAQGAEAMNADALVSELRELPPHMDPEPFSVLCDKASPCPRPLSPAAAKRKQIYDQLYTLGASGVPALARALKSSDVNLRRNAALALGVLGDGWWFWDRRPTKTDISAALPALVASLSDSDTIVQSYAAQDIGYIGPSAAGAVPKLVALLSASDEGVRNGACLGLTGIGPAAKRALPALRRVLSDPSPYTRRFARLAIESIESGSRPTAPGDAIAPKLDPPRFLLRHLSAQRPQLDERVVQHCGGRDSSFRRDPWRLRARADR